LERASVLLSMSKNGIFSGRAFSCPGSGQLRDAQLQ
jgi:hypothetical protein